MPSLALSGPDLQAGSSSTSRASADGHHRTAPKRSAASTAWRVSGESPPAWSAGSRPSTTSGIGSSIPSRPATEKICSDCARGLHVRLWLRPAYNVVAPRASPFATGAPARQRKAVAVAASRATRPRSFRPAIGEPSEKSFKTLARPAPGEATEERPFERARGAPRDTRPRGAADDWLAATGAGIARARSRNRSQPSLRSCEEVASDQGPPRLEHMRLSSVDRVARAGDPSEGRRVGVMESHVPRWEARTADPRGLLLVEGEQSGQTRAKASIVVRGCR